MICSWFINNFLFFGTMSINEQSVHGVSLPNVLTLESHYSKYLCKMTKVFDSCSIYEQSLHFRHSCGLSNWHLGVEHPVVLDRQLSYHGSCLAIFLIKFSLFLTNQIFFTMKHSQKTSPLINIFTAFNTTLF